jgi:50S ribosomal protein L16 3-hydroxylase
MTEYRLRVQAEDFLATYWQRRHLFIAQGITPFAEPADADELAGLARETGVDSRIVSRVNGEWHQQRGPFSIEDYRRADAWTLLVQSVDHHWDDAAALLSAVDFLPRWRLDDVMMSYATDGGSAGPHFDNYDVFIVQGAGQRRWQIGGFCDASSPLLENTDIRLLADFQPEHEYLMNTGDVLYIPPGCAHFGVSLGESTSFSIGFRAPRISDLLAHWADNRLASLEDDTLYQDAGRERSSATGEITREDLARAQKQLMRVFEDADCRWLGEAITARGAEVAGQADAVLEDLEALGSAITRVPGSRLAWMHGDGELLVFAHGASREAPLELQPLIEALCAHQDIPLAEALSAHDASRALLHWLFEEDTILLYD